MGVNIKTDRNIVRVVKGSIFAILITAIFLLIYAILLTSTNISENTMTAVVITVSGVSILIGSSISSFKIKKQGIINGALVGLIYITALYLLSSIIFVGFELNLSSIIMLVVSIITGMIGGIIGVNL